MKTNNDVLPLRVKAGMLAAAMLALAALLWSQGVRAEEVAAPVPADESVVTETVPEAGEGEAAAMDEETTTSGFNFAEIETEAETGETVVETEVPLPPGETEAPAEEAAGAADASSTVEAIIETLTATPELSTDKGDYHPGETATIFGRFFAPLQSFMVKVFGSDEQNQNYTETTTEVTTDENGSFSLTYLLDMLYRPFYEVVVSTLEGEKVTETYFRDAAVPIYDQCSNNTGTGYTTSDTGCRWTTGAINGSNSVYQEGDATVQRVGLDGFEPGSTHSITLQYGTTKSGKHAYDFLTSWDHSENWITLADRCQDIVGCTTAAETSFPIPNDTNGSGQFQGTVGARNFVMRGGTITAVSAPVKTGDYAGDSETEITVTFTVDNSGPMCVTKKMQGNDETTCGAALWFGAHIARTAQWQSFNGTFGATSISGSPYHVALLSLDGGSVGQRDNQMQASAIPATLIIRKDTVPDAAQDFSFTTTGTGLSNFSLDDDNDGTLSNTKTFILSNGGNFTVTEGLAAGYSLTNLVCTDPTNNTTVNLGTRTATIALAASETVECTFTNTLQTGSITIVKNTVGGNGQFNFTSNIAGNFALNTTNNTASQSFNNVVAGTYSVTETVPAGWQQTSATCSDGSPVNAVNLAAGENVTCTFTNTKDATLTLVKTAVNDNGGDADAGDFQGKIDGNNVPWAAAQTVAVGAHTASETTLPGYTASAWGGDCAADGSVTIAAGDSKTCTITNDDVAPELTVIKHVINDDGGSKVAGDFTMNVTATNPSDDSFAGSETGTTITLNAGNYAVDETELTGYTKSLGANCSGTIAVGEKKTCTITNDDQPGTLVVHKVTNPDSDTTTSFTITATADSGLVEGTAQQTIVGGETETYTVHAGVYDVAEAPLAGWDMTGNTCENVAVGNGEEKHCTITNTKKGHLIVEKTTLPSGDTTSFAITASGSGTITGGGAGSVTDATNHDYEVTPGTYSVEETTPAGFDMTENTCDDVEVAAGETKYCSITNVKRGSITIVKDAINNHAQDFTFNNNFGNGHPATFKLDDDGNVTLPNTRTFAVLPGTYAVSEDAVAGWQQESATCSDQSPVGAIDVAPGENVTCTFVNEEYAKIILIKNTQGGNGDFDFDGTGDGLSADIDLTTVAGTASVTFSDLDQDNTYSITENVPAGWTLMSSVCSGTNTPAEITPNPGETVTCTFTNGKLPTLTLEKTVVNNYGGTAEADDFQGKISNVDQAWGIAKTLTPGSYTASETNLFGYSASSWGTDCAANGSVTLAYGDSKTCSITNSDIAPKLTVIKHVINDNGGDDVAGDFTMNVTGTEVSDDSFAGSETGTTVTLDAGDYSVDESAHAGYTKTLGEDCSGTIGIGEEKTCTITNNDQPAKITLTKVVVNNNGGSAAPNDFGLTIGGDAAVSGVTYEVDSNTAHALNEAGLAGYAFDSLTGDAKCPAVLGGTVELGEGEEVSCTITNDDIPAHLIVIKHVDNGNTGATAEADDFTTTISGVTTANPVANGAEAPGIDNVLTSVGAYSVDEGAHPGYTKTLSADCSGTIALGQTKTCTITNTAIAPKLTVIKVVDNGNTGATYGAGDFQMKVDGDNVPQNVAQTETVGVHTVTETGPAGYTATWSGDCDEDGDVTLGLADDKTCTITNTAIAPKLTLIKTVINDHGGQKGVADFPLSIGATTVTSGVANSVTVGQHTVSEVADPGYTASAWGGDCAENGTVTLALADDKTCTITNNDKPGKLEIIKNTVGGNDTFDFTVDGASDSTPSVTTAANTGTTGVFEVNAGSYSVTEATKTGWDLTSASCTNGTPATFTIGNGETVTCTFTNTKRATVTIIKDAQPQDTQDFAFSGSFGAFTLDDDAGVQDALLPNQYSNSVTFTNVVPGAKTITETQPNQYWKLKSASCVVTGTNTVVPSSLSGGTLSVTAEPGANITCTFVNEKMSPTRTQGFWQTHTAYTSAKFTQYFGVGGMTIGTPLRKTVVTSAQLFGAWYSSIPKMTNGKQRTALDKARMQLLQQLVTAKLNCAAFGCTTGVQTMIANADAAYSGTSATAILAASALVDAYNNSGDSISVGNAGKATPKTSQDVANKAFWDTP